MGGPRAKLAATVDVLEDAALLLAAGPPTAGASRSWPERARWPTPARADGRTARAGGWGPLLGDEGSGYAIALAGLRAAARRCDGRAPATPSPTDCWPRAD